ncbi:MAG: hypothetical protein ACHQHN_15270 [Sphingobacteriales bacterium]
MKNLIKTLAFLAVMTLFGCTKVLYTHEQVLGRYKTKQQVLQKFGAPTEIKPNQTGEEWLYTYDADQIMHVFSTNTVSELGQYKNYVQFSFDNQGIVISRHAEGVDLSEKKVSILKTSALAVGIAALIYGFVSVGFHSAQPIYTGGPIHIDF